MAPPLDQGLEFLKLDGLGFGVAFLSLGQAFAIAKTFAEAEAAEVAAQRAAQDRETAAAEKRGWDAARAQTSSLTKTLADKGMTVGKTPAAVETDLAKVGATMADEWLKKAGADGKTVLDAARR